MTWRTTPLRSVAEVTLGRQRAPENADGPHMVPYLRAANVADGEILLDDVLSMNFSPAEQVRFALRDGDVLVTEGCGSIAQIGASATYRGELGREVCFQNTLLRLRPRSEGIEARFLAWWARAAYVSGLFSSIAAGANIYHLSAERVRALPVLLPPPDEQRRIADFLDIEIARFDQVAGRRLHQIERLDERAFATASERLIPGILDRPMGTWPWEWLPNLDHDRPLVRLGYVCRLQTGLTVDASRNLMRGEVVTRPYLRVANVQAGHLDLENVADVTVPIEVAVRSTLQPGDVLMTEGGDLDKLGRGTVWYGDVTHCLHQNHIFALRPDPAKLDGRYLAYMTQTLHGRCYFESTGVKTTNLASTNSTKILSFPVPLPPLPQQRRLVADVDRSLENIGRARSTLQRQHALLLERRQVLITAAVAGHHSAGRRGHS